MHLHNTLGPILLTWINLSRNDLPREVWDEIAYQFPNFNGVAVEVWEWMKNFIPHVTIDIITYPN